MNLIFIAPPAAGKGTQSELLCNNRNFYHLSTGDLLREAISKNDENSIKLNQIIEQGKLVGDDIILDLISKEIGKDRDYIFDGFPRNLKQAISLDQLLVSLNRKVDYVIYLKVDKFLAQKRILGRLSCSNCGSVYNSQIEESNPKIEGICDDCGASLIKRTDDNEETFNNRFDTYMKETEPVINYYKDLNILYELDSSLDKYIIFDEIKKIIGVK